MTTFLAPVAVGIVLGSLLTGFASHVAAPSALRDALRQHRTLPRRAVPPVTLAVPVAEGVLGLAGLVALFGGSRTGVTVVMAASAALFGTYTGYLRHVLASGRGGPCGCSRSDVPLSGWAVGRAFTYALLAVAGALLAQAAVPLLTDPAELATVLLAVATFTALLWYWPLALHNPAHHPAEGDAAPWTS
ncbi:MauE/DoxX family redox-associated membrane protein [Streptomyces sp. NPDC005438]|uniref:MauE/DoxX family redox-associated membrane protein n=1 Tax=Streptomyces sp. NPDC005438 TaxID=3156880 RepID=UPI0033B2A5F4